MPLAFFSGSARLLELYLRIQRNELHQIDAARTALVVTPCLSHRDMPPLFEHVTDALVECLEVAARRLDDGQEPLTIGPPEALRVVGVVVSLVVLMRLLYSPV